MRGKLLVFGLYSAGIAVVLVFGWVATFSSGEESEAPTPTSSPLLIPTAPLPPLLAAHPALTIPLTTLEDTPTALQRWGRGTVVVLLWASWCEVCVGELDELAQAAAQMSPRVTFVVVNRAEPLETTKEVKQKIELAQKGRTENLVFLSDPRDALFGSFQGRGMPLIVVLRDGKEVARFERFADEEEIRAVVGAL
ncbi:TlpA family protein disulfide reductase [Candidatus Parcubacteria bacterium]|nr:MAG: TlpA family protein disulfide reductase [Candidatus Parcubacteria bacterium]GIW68760.1 MAG: hypothetical protein KatS3mg100_254 [Candidatus Parcubacteria bacterium]